MSVVYKKLEDVCEILDSRRVPITAKDRKAGTYPYYGANGLQDYVADYIFDDELVLLAEDGGNFGSKERPIAYRVSGKCWVNNHAHVLKAKSNMHVDYLCYALMFYDTEGLVNGATRQKLTQAAMRQMVIPYRDMTEQLQIIKKISQIVRSIEKRKEELQLLDQLVKSRFIELFGDADRFEAAPLDDNVVEMFIGPFGSSLKNECFVAADQGYCMVYEQKHAIKKTMDVDTRYINEKKYKELHRFTVRGGDIIVSCRGTIGETFIIPEGAPFGIMHPSIMKIRLKASAYNRVFFNHLLQTVLDRHAAEANGSGVKMAITATALGKEHFILPPMELQEQFAAFVEQTDKSKYYSSLSFRYCQAAANTYRQEWMTCRTSDF